MRIMDIGDKLLRRIRGKGKDKFKKYVSENYSLDRGIPTVDIADIFSPFNATINNYTYLEGTSLPIDIAILKEFAKTFKNCKYFEIGTWRGESVINVAEIADECQCLSLSEAEMRALNFSEKFIELNGYFSKHKKNIKHIWHNSLTFNFESLKDKFDLIFIDGDHSYESVKSDTINIQKIMHPNSIVVWHDYGVTTERINWEVLAGILDGSPEKWHGKIMHMSNTLCAFYSPNIYKSKFKTFPAKPTKTFTINIQVNQK